MTSIADATDGFSPRLRTNIAVLAAIQIGATAALGLAATHNGWMWFHGGDQIWFTSGSRAAAAG